MPRFVTLLALISASLLNAQDVLVNQGVAAFKSANYQQAVDLFSQAVAAHPNEVNPQLYLGTAYMSMWIPGLASPENASLARSAETAFLRVLELDGNNATAVASLASLTYNSASSLHGEEKSRKLDEAMDWYKRLAALNPMNKEAPYSMGVIAWSKWYPALMTARANLNMKPQDPGPLPDAAVLQQLKAQYSSLIEEGISNLDRALKIDPNYSDAMAYMNLLIRERADLLDTKAEYARDIAVADQWVHKALVAKQSQVTSGTSIAPPHPPEPPISQAGDSRVLLRDGGMIQPQSITPVVKVDPVYPPLARQARIEGSVRFTVTLGKDGSIQKIQLISGHPLLVYAAQDAVKKYVYNPVLLNGSPVEAVTQVDVNFVLGN